MDEVTDGIINNLGIICDYVKVNLRTVENYEEIKRISLMANKNF